MQLPVNKPFKIAPVSGQGGHSRTPMRRETLRVALIGLTVLLDCIAMIAAFKLVEEMRQFDWLSPGGVSLLLIALPAYVYFGAMSSSFSSTTIDRFTVSFAGAMRAFLCAMLVLIVCAFFAKFSLKISRSSFSYAIILSAGLLAISRALVTLLVRWKLKSHLSDRLLIADRRPGELPTNVDLLDLSEVRLRPDLYSPVQMAEISERIARYDVVYLKCDDEAERDGWITTLKASGVACEVVVPAKSLHAAIGIGRLGGGDTLILSRGPLSLGSRVKKRLFDLVVGGALLIFIAPLMVLVAILIRLESPGPAIFTQMRIGQANRPFRIYKFRSMRQAAADPDGHRSTARDDDRLTRIGAFIRRTSIDEIPQLFNVVLGNMSLVGPRPHAMGSKAGEQLFWEVSEHYWMRHALKPGITGLAQINGYRGATHCRADLEARLRFDLLYLQSWSLWNDVVILLTTIRVVSHANAY
jgi:exopolysaccharide biosynthesis polyprenyl glycosylphosphotransferase